MTGIRLLTAQNRVPGVHPPQACMCSQIRPLALEAAHRCIDYDTVSDVSLASRQRLPHCTLEVVKDIIRDAELL